MTEPFVLDESRPPRRPFIPFNEEQLKIINHVVYDKKFYYGTVKLYHYLKENYPEMTFPQRAITDWLTKQEFYQITKQVPKRINTRPIHSSKKGGILQADLIDFSKTENSSYNYILMVIDIFSKFLWAYPIKEKTVANCREKLLELYNERPFKVLQLDNGGEFQFELPNVKILRSNSYTPQNQAVVERTNGTLKRQIYKYWNISGTKRWLEILPDLVENYNNSYQSTIKMTPAKAETLNENQQKDLNKVIKDKNRKNYTPEDKATFQIGDLVRILIVKKGKKKTGDHYSKMTYKIVDILKAHPDRFSRTRYKLENENGETIGKTYNNSQVQKITEIQKPPVQTSILPEPVAQEIQSLTRVNDTFPTVDLTPKNKNRRQTLSRTVQELNRQANHSNLTPSSSKRN